MHPLGQCNMGCRQQYHIYSCGSGENMLYFAPSYNAPSRVQMDWNYWSCPIETSFLFCFTSKYFATLCLTEHPQWAFDSPSLISILVRDHIMGLSHDKCKALSPEEALPMVTKTTQGSVRDRVSVPNATRVFPIISLAQSNCFRQLPLGMRPLTGEHQTATTSRGGCSM